MATKFKCKTCIGSGECQECEGAALIETDDYEYTSEDDSSPTVSDYNPYSSACHKCDATGNCQCCHGFGYHLGKHCKGIEDDFE